MTAVKTHAITPALAPLTLKASMRTKTRTIGARARTQVKMFIDGSPTLVTSIMNYFLPFHIECNLILSQPCYNSTFATANCVKLCDSLVKFVFVKSQRFALFMRFHLFARTVFSSEIERNIRIAREYADFSILIIYICVQ